MIRDSEGSEYRDWLTSIARIAFEHNPYPQIPIDFNELNNVIELGNCAHVAMSPDYEPWVRAQSTAYFFAQSYDIEFSAAIEKRCGVYILYNETDILYVGQSKNVKSRVSSHNHIPFTEYIVAYTSEENLIPLEAIAIGFLRPMMNFSRSDRYRPIVSEVSRCRE